ncbi:HAMP domain-containing methyl-accepting chemotaxis protein [Alteriqipengyuania lutimaris]|uniref:HAMP domain-containing protein n=1 Tax=Alteriqipengyuania lutimaris TaxID=1538146 RepID=A0A395LMT8_9SPHN|nr:methyl-accepting chemotaxis protein [Alteriqipengyuania lutimaris]MBB3032510.1 methyl-accepting chemotaxis protein [Alteriqipengyuania lutimaris]RDS78356.1 HAMP domain-containing protein [Alteriqipengyuania lutimaris]
MLSRLNDWPLSRKMMLAFGALFIAFASMATISYVAEKSALAYAEESNKRGLMATTALARVQDQIKQYRILVFAHVNRLNEEDRINTEERMVKAHDTLHAAMADYAEAAELSEREGEPVTRDYAQLQSAIEQLEATNEELVAISSTQPREEAIQFLRTNAKEASHAAIEAVDTLVAEVVNTREAAFEEAHAFGQRMQLFSILISLFGVGVLAAIWFGLSRSVAAPLAALADTTQRLADGNDLPVPSTDRSDEVGQIAKAVDSFRIAAAERSQSAVREAEEQRVVTTALSNGLTALSEGDLTSELKVDFPPAYAELKTNFNDAVIGLREMISAVSASAEAIGTGSREIAQASEDLARRTESNAASLEETSASLAQIDERLRASAKSGTQTVARADTAISTVKDGRSIADEAVQAMGRVSESAKGIDAVIEGLDKIAFQTRVLAMNAAVEAGRAGEAGRGFAVVADLVSALAMRAEEEAQLARDQLTVTQTDIGTAVGAVQRVDGALAEITEGVGEVHQLLGTMAADNQTQSSSVTEISSAISSMDQSTQQNAAMVEETSAAARNLMSEVASLSERAARFNTGGGAAALPKPGKAPVKVTAPASSVTASARGREEGYVSPVAPLRSNGADHGAADWNDF